MKKPMGTITVRVKVFDIDEGVLFEYEPAYTQTNASKGRITGVFQDMMVSSSLTTHLAALINFVKEPRT